MRPPTPGGLILPYSGKAVHTRRMKPLAQQGEGCHMARKAKPVEIKVTHIYTPDPEAVERGLELWASFLARHLMKRLAEERHQAERETGSA